MKLRFYDVLCALAAIGLLLLGASYAHAAPAPASSVPPWMWGIVSGVVILLVGVCGWWVRRWIERRERWEEMILAEVRAVREDGQHTRSFVGIIKERMDHLPCRTPRNGVPPPPSALCSLHDKDADT